MAQPLDPNVQALVNALNQNQGQGGRRKVVEFESGNGPEWLAWKEGFRQVNQINGWEDLRARRELKAAMTQTAAKVTRDIQPEDAANLDEMIQLLEARFLPEGAGIAARTEFEHMTQNSTESLLEWHSRVRDTFTRAFPNVNVQGDYRARDKFALGLKDKTLQWEVYREDAVDFTDALQRATRIAARLAKVGEIHKSAAPPASNHFGINSVVPVTAAVATTGSWNPSTGRGRSSNGRNGNQNQGPARNPDGSVDLSRTECYVCKKKGHMKRQCRTWQRRMRDREEAEKKEGKGKINAIEVPSEENLSTEEKTGNS